jgi:tetratricopeptide (TPR) repeat protein
MKKLFILGLCLMAVAGASAQKSLVKEVEGKAKGFNADYAAARNQLKPALTNPETQNEAQTWYVAGTVEFGDFDNMYGKQAVGQGKEEEKAAMGRALINGYNYFMTAFPLDTIVEVDKKTGAPKLNKDGSPKTKTKYSKDMVKKLTAHWNDYVSGGQYLWDAKDYDGAYEAWNIYTSMPANPSLGSDAPAVPADTVIGQMCFYQGLAAWQAEKLDVALERFEKAYANNYHSPQMFDYAIGVAAQMKDDPKIIELAETANKLYGDTLSNYLLIIINDKINNKKYEEAQTLLEKAISMNPTQAEFYDVLGILYQSQNNLEKARENFAKAISMKPDFVKAKFDLGRAIYAQAGAIDEASANLPTEEFNKVRAEKVTPLLKESIPYLEEALNDSTTFDDARLLLRSIYYTLDDAVNLKRIEAM